MNNPPAGAFFLLATTLLATTLTSCFGSGTGLTPIHTPFNRAVYLYSSGNYQQAIAEYREALVDDPSDYRARFNLAIALEAAANEQEFAGDAANAASMRRAAEAEYTLLVKHDECRVRAGIQLAALEFERNEPAVAKARLLALSEQHPQVTMVQTALAAHYLATDDAQGAADVLKAAVANDPANLIANRLLGDAYAVLNDIPAARQAYEQALRRAGDDLSTLMARAQLEMQAGEFQEASVWLSRVLLIDADNGLAHLLQSRAMEQLGLLEDATLHLWLARRSSRSHLDASETSRHLRLLYQKLLEQEAPAIRSDDQ